jgi:uncharacterized protein YifE (UPF0438 family)
MKDLDTVGFISNMQVVIGRAENDIEWAKISARTKKNAEFCIILIGPKLRTMTLEIVWSKLT